MARPATAAVRLLTGEREPVRLATTANIALSGLQTIDGVLTEVGDRVLVKNQTDATANGIYTASAGQWYRASDARTSRTMQKGTTVHVQQGTVAAGNVYVFQTFEPVIGTDGITISFYTSEDLIADANAAAAAAAASASAASTSASGAATSASAASTSAGAAATSASSASTSASTATTQASNAAGSASAASTSATNAGNSATAAAGSASAASTSASNASTSASTATTQASNASTSATNAATSATAAANSVDALGYNFSTTTTDADPGAGIFRLNNATPGSATAAYIDNTDADGVSATGVLDTWDDSTNTVRGVLTIRSKTNATIRHAYNVTGSVVDGTGYRKLTLAYVGGSGTLTNAAAHWLIFDRSGDAGAGDFSGPGSSVADNILTFSNTGGKTGKDSGVAIASVLREVALSTGASAAANASTLQAAINAATDTTLFLPAGDFVIDAVTLKPGVALRGRGKHATRLLCGSNSINMLSYTATASIKTDFAIRDIGFEVNGKTSAIAIKLDGNTSAIRISQVLFQNLEFNGAFTTGISVKFCANTTMLDVLASNCTNGYTIDNCADTDVIDCRAQNGSGIGFYVNGGAGAFDEGVRMQGCSTNGQGYGLYINGQDWGCATGCSFTTSPSGSLVMTSATNWKFTGCEFAVAGGTPASPGALVDVNCTDVIFTGCHFVLNTFGITLAGARHSVVGCIFKANSNTDIYVTATQAVIANNICHSTGVASSIAAATPENYGNFQGNVTNGTVTKFGANSVAANNIVY